MRLVEPSEHPLAHQRAPELPLGGEACGLCLATVPVPTGLCFLHRLNVVGDELDELAEVVPHHLDRVLEPLDRDCLRMERAVLEPEAGDRDRVEVIGLVGLEHERSGRKGRPSAHEVGSHGSDVELGRFVGVEPTDSAEEDPVDSVDIPRCPGRGREGNGSPSRVKKLGSRLRLDGMNRISSSAPPA